MNTKITMKEIQAGAEKYVNSARKLREIQDIVNEEIADIKSKYMPELIELSREVISNKKELESMVSAGAELFEKPKTHSYGGVKFGFQKQKGKLEIVNIDTTIKILERDYPELAELVIKTNKSIIKDTLNNQSADILKKIGVQISSDTDAVIVKLTDTDIEKVINAILKEQQV